MKIKNLSTLIILVVMSYSLLGQTKMEIYTNPNIVWAGIIDIDIVIDRDTSFSKNIDLKYYEISGLGKYLKQYEKDLKSNKKPLNALILENASTVQFYEYDSLKYRIDYQGLDLYNTNYEPENYGDEEGKLPASAFDVFRLHCFIYYDKSTLDFQLKPLAAAVLRSENDTGDKVIGYQALGWLPIKEWQKSLNLNNNSIRFAKRFYRDIAFEDVRVFKQEWTIEQTMEQMLEEIRKQHETIKLKTSDIFEADKLLSIDEIKELGTDMIYAIRFDTYEEEETYVPWNSQRFKGVRLTLDWAWEDAKKSILIKKSAFAPLYAIEDDGGVILYYENLFVKWANE